MSPRVVCRVTDMIGLNYAIQREVLVQACPGRRV